MKNTSSLFTSVILCLALPFAFIGAKAVSSSAQCQDCIVDTATNESALHLDKDKLNLVTHLSEMLAPLRVLGTADGIPISWLANHADISKLSSAFDVARSNENKRLFEQAISKYPIDSKVTKAIEETSNLAANFDNFVLPLTISLTVIFEDGSAYDFTIESIKNDPTTKNPTLSVKARRKSGKIEGEVIPEDKNWEGRIIDIPVQHADKWLKAAENAGISISKSWEAEIPSSNVRMACNYKACEFSSI